MRIVSVRCRGFLSYDEIDIDLSDLSLAVIIGENGAGKSSMITAITWALWGKHDREEGVIGDDFDECAVDIEFLTQGKHWRVQRYAHRSGRNSTLTLVEVGTETVVQDVKSSLRVEHTIPQTQAEIDKKIGLSYDAITAGPIMLQDQASTFMSLDPRARKDLLIKLFGVEVYEVYHKEASARAAAYGRDADKAGAEVERLEEIVAGEEAAKAALRDARYDLATETAERDRIENELIAARERQVALREQARHAATLQQTVASLKQRIEDDQKEHTRLLRVISDAHNAVDLPAPTYEPLPDVSDDVIQRALTAYDKARSGVDMRRGLEAQMPLLQEQLARSERQASLVDTVPCGGQGIYATCRFLTSAPTEEELNRQREEIEARRSSLNGLPDEGVLLAAQQKHSTLQGAQFAVQKETLRRETEHAQWKLKVENAAAMVQNGQDSIDRLLAQIARDQSVLVRSTQQLGEVQSDQSAVMAVEMQVEALKMQSDEHGRTVEMVYRPAVTRAEEAVRLIEEAKTEYARQSKLYREAKRKADVYVLLTKAFHRDGIPTMILESGIPLIEERANEILERMPEPRVVRILTQYENKKGGMVDKVKVITERNGHQRGYGNLSGGEKFRTNFALRIAIGSVLSHRSGTSIQTLILDEGWGTQDEKGTAAMLESIAAVQDQFELVLIVTHVKEVIDRFQSRIEFIRPDDTYSSVRIAA